MDASRDETSSAQAEVQPAPSADDRQDWAAPTIGVPKGGGAIRGIGEKLTPHLPSGTISLSVPVAVSPGRGGFGPDLSLSYESSAGNGPFGFGWQLSLPAITRQTDKGLPKYFDSVDSDVFVLSGVEDLVPDLAADGLHHTDTTTEPGFAIDRYVPRVEGLFARIERWTRLSDGEVHWRSISSGNVLTIYGGDRSSRVADPLDPARVFSWRISEARDDKGNAIIYDYKAEDGTGADLTATHQRNRGPHNAAQRTANRYIKRIRYGNRVPLLDNAGRRPQLLTAAQILGADWMFEVVFDYGEHNPLVPMPLDAGAWVHRVDAFSSYRSGFEIRTARICRRILMFHHFPAEAGVGADCLVRSTDFVYSHEANPLDARNPVYTFLRGVTHSGYRRDGAGYLKRTMPPVEFEYSLPVVQQALEEIDRSALEHLPAGVDGTAYRWIDLHGEGTPGVLSEQAGAWFYKRNLSPMAPGSVQFAPVETVTSIPNVSLARNARLMDLAGDGLLDVVVTDPSSPGLYEHDERADGWQPFRPFTSWASSLLADANARIVDLDGDGRGDVLVTEDDAFVWYPSLGEEGFAAGARIGQPMDEERGPRLVFADPSNSIYLADMNGDGLTDLVRVRNGDVCYWPNVGYGRFGAKVSMDGSPVFDRQDAFDQRRVRLADIDGTGTIDLIYLHADGVRLYFNQSGNGWSAAQRIDVLPRLDDLGTVVATDLLGNGTACLVWSSPLPADVHRQIRYVNLMGGRKPHLLVGMVNNLGAETHIDYAPSTTFYLRDRAAGRPWITRLPFPVHVVERVETVDRIGRNRFVSSYAYHHGYFDGLEREFRGFGMVEQADTEVLAALTASSTLPAAENESPASDVPPLVTKTWYHTGVYLGGEHVSDFFAGLVDAQDTGEYYREPGLTDAQARMQLLRDTILPPGLTADEEREACRALKGTMLRQEVYARDGSNKEGRPYTVSEQNRAIRVLQRQHGNRHAVFLVHGAESLSCHYERAASDPRREHKLTLEVDGFGNVVKEASVAYGRQQPDLSLLPADRDTQALARITYTESLYTNANLGLRDAHRVPMPAESRSYELTGYTPTDPSGRFRAADFVQNTGGTLALVFDSEVNFEDRPTAGRQRRLIAQTRTLYRPDDLGSAAGDPATLLPLAIVEPRAITGERYTLALTPGLLTNVFRRDGQTLLPNPATVLAGAAGGYVRSQDLKADGRFPATDPDDHWWIPTGRVFLSGNPADTAAQELLSARAHFFLPRRTRDPFHSSAVPTESRFSYDAYDLLLADLEDPAGNRMTVGERLVNGTIDPAVPGNDYRVLKPRRVMDANRNRREVAFDVLGQVVGTAVMGKPGQAAGDTLAGFDPDLSDAVQLAHLANPLTGPDVILAAATTRVVYDLFAYHRTRAAANPDPPVAYTLARETHAAETTPASPTRIRHLFLYCDGFGREIQTKAQAAPLVIGGVPRWIGSGWTIFNNKAKPFREYEPFFSATHAFEFAAQAGIGTTYFYDPLMRVMATLHPNHTYEKVVFDTWRQVTSDTNDTVTSDPRTDPDVQGFTAGFFASLPPSPPAPPWLTWRASRIGGALGADEQAAAIKASAHADTPATIYVDALGRAFLSVADNGTDPGNPAQHLLSATRLSLDISGQTLATRDAVTQAGDPLGRIVMQYAYDLAGNRVREVSMEAGARWALTDVASKPIRGWDSLGREVRTEYDAMRRPQRIFVTGANPALPAATVMAERFVYGEQHPDALARNLRSHAYAHFDQAGVTTDESVDFKGNVLAVSRRLAADYRVAVDWTPVDATVPAAGPLTLAAFEAAIAPLVDAETFSGATTYDATDRPTRITTPHTPTMAPSLIRPGYDEGGQLQTVDVNLRGATAGGAAVWTPFVTRLQYDAKGQRERIDYGNGVSTLYTYDPETFRLVALLTRRDSTAFPGDCPQPPASGWPGCEVQNFHYTYDPVGNVTGARDTAQQAVYFRNRRVEPSASYTYDALYRLIEATGREHLGAGPAPPIPHSSGDIARTGLPHPGDGTALGTYVERYVYDLVGNLRDMQHIGTDPIAPGWTRHYTYAETSQIEDGTGGLPLKTSNRISETTVGAGAAERYVYDRHGNMVRLPHLGGAHPAPNVSWDYRNQIRRVDLGGGGVAFMVYGGDGGRVRKVWEKTATLTEERLYLGGFEIFRRRQAGDLLERETVHVMDDSRRIAMIETRTADSAGTDAGPAEVTRYQFANHLHSACLELDDAADVISYEEYSPFGSTTYQAVRNQTETPKRYRFGAKERDAETGLYYHGARHYAPWLGRWVNPDPAGMIDGPNLYAFARLNPIRYSDPSGMQATSDLVNSGSPNDPRNYATFEDFRAGNRAPYSEQGLRDAWNAAHPTVPFIGPPAPPPQPQPAPAAPGAGHRFTVTTRSFAPFETFGNPLPYDVGGGYHGDNRDFSADPRASSRVSQSTTVTIGQSTSTNTSSTHPSIGYGLVPTGASIITLNWLDSSLGVGEQEGSSVFNYGLRVTGDPAPVSSTGSASSSGSTVTVSQDYASAMPLANLTWDINVHNRATLTTTTTTGGNYVLNVTGQLSGDEFPAAEVLVVDSSGQSVLVHTFAAAHGPAWGPIVSLAGDSDDPMGSYNVSINVDSSGQFTTVQGASGPMTLSDYNRSRQGTYRPTHTIDAPTRAYQWLDRGIRGIYGFPF